MRRFHQRKEQKSKAKKFFSEVTAMADLMAQERACDRTSDNSKQRDLFPKARAIENGGLFMQTGAMESGGFKKGET